MTAFYVALAVFVAFLAGYFSYGWGHARGYEDGRKDEKKYHKHSIGYLYPLTNADLTNPYWAVVKYRNDGEPEYVCKKGLTYQAALELSYSLNLEHPENVYEIEKQAEI